MLILYQDPEGTTVFGTTDINNRTKQSNAEEEVTLATLRRRIKDLEKKITDTEVVMDSFITICVLARRRIVNNILHSQVLQDYIYHYRELIQILLLTEKRNYEMCSY